MKNPLYNGDRIYLARIGGDAKVIPVTYSRNGIATAWRGFSDEILSRAGGYGYDKESEALSKAVARLIREHGGKEEDACEIEKTGGMGVYTVMRVSCEHGYELDNSYSYALDTFTRGYSMSTTATLTEAIKKHGIERVKEIVYSSGGEVGAMSMYINSRAGFVRDSILARLSE